MTPLQAKCGWWLMEPEGRHAFAATFVALGIMSEAAAKALADEPLSDPFNPQRHRGSRDVMDSGGRRIYSGHRVKEVPL